MYFDIQNCKTFKTVNIKNYRIEGNISCRQKKKREYKFFFSLTKREYKFISLCYGYERPHNKINKYKRQSYLLCGTKNHLNQLNAFGWDVGIIVPRLHWPFRY